MDLKQKVMDGVSKVKTYWKTPMAGRQMTFREIAAYSGGGIGAYMIITLGTQCLLAVNNVLLSSTLGVGPTDMYIMYVIAVLANIPLTGIRASIIDNTRNKAGKYRPYIVTMAIPAALICNIMVWFPYNKLADWVGTAPVIGDKTMDYVVKCAILMVLNLLLHFFYYFFYDSYENLIHVLSNNTQERADVASVKSIVYSIAPTLVNLFTPIIAQHVFHSNTTDIRVYRLLYPILTVGGILLCIIVYKYTEEKIVQARTHVVQIKFIDALKAVAKNKYFWIISLASWIGFLESSYTNILNWLYNYGGSCSGTVFGIVVTVYGNASLWGMLLAPFCIRKWGKKAVLVVTNIFNILFILLMLPFTKDPSSGATIWLVMGCLYFNALMGSFAHILNPSIQADIRDYQQYKTGERIDGMFAAVATIGTVIALITSSVVPIIQENAGITIEGAKAVTSRPEILSRMLGDGKTVGEILAEQMANGQNNYINPFSALYDPDILIHLLQVLIIISAVGALLNVIPYAWYDFDEIKQKSIIRVLKIRAMFEDYGNGVLNDGNLVEAVDIIKKARDMNGAAPKEINKKAYKSIKDKAQRKLAKKQLQADMDYNDEIKIGAFVCDELDKFQKPEFQFAYQEAQKLYSLGLDGYKAIPIAQAKAELNTARSMPKSNDTEKTIRKVAIANAKLKISSLKAYHKYFANSNVEFKHPDFAVLDDSYNEEDRLDSVIQKLYLDIKEAKKLHDSAKVSALKAELKKNLPLKKAARKNSKVISDSFAYFNRAAKAYLDAEKLINQKENYTKFDEIAQQYEESKVRYEKQLADEKAEQERKQAEEDAINAKIKAEKAAKKLAKKNK